MKTKSQLPGFAELNEAIDWQKVDQLLPVIIQDFQSKVVLMQGYMNQDALQQSLDSGQVTFFSRSKQRLWMKGETSGHTLEIVDLKLDCDQDCLLVQALPQGPTCHRGSRSCFEALPNRPEKALEHRLHFLSELGDLIRERHQSMPEGSYTTKLFKKGLRKMAQKVGEEGVEVALAAVDEDDDSFINEASDLIFHLLVLLEGRGKTLSQVTETLRSRHTIKAK